jgi:hypothetical protein
MPNVKMVAGHDLCLAGTYQPSLLLALYRLIIQAFTARTELKLNIYSLNNPTGYRLSMCSGRGLNRDGKMNLAICSEYLGKNLDIIASYQNLARETGFFSEHATGAQIQQKSRVFRNRR